MQRILHVISAPHGIGGAELILGELLAEGRRRGWKQRVVNLFGPNSQLNSLLGSEQPIELRGRSPLSLKRMRAALIAEFMDFQPEVAHAHLFHASVMCSLLPREFRRSLLLTHHHGDFYQVEGRTLPSVIDKWATRRFPTVVAVSRHSHNYLAEQYGLRPPTLRLISNGLRTRPVEYQMIETPTIVCVGGFRPEKGHSTLLTAVSLLKDEFPNLRALFVGDGPLRSEIEQAINALDLRQNVELVGWTEDVESYFVQGRVAVVPSLIEQFGLVVLEAMSAGIPVVATNVGGIPELITDHENGILVPPGQPAALADGIRELFRSSELAARIGNNGRSTAASMPMDKTIQAYYALYGELAKTSREHLHIGNSALNRTS